MTNEIELNGNFKSDISYSKNSLKYFRSLKNLKYLKNVNQLSANLNNNFFVIFDRTYKLKKYDYKINGDLSRANLNMNKILNDKYFKKKSISFH